jgi:hypothetical protein
LSNVERLGTHCFRRYPEQRKILLNLIKRIFLRRTGGGEAGSMPSINP